MNEIKVNQNAGAVLVLNLELDNFPTLFLTSANKAISIAKAIRVKRAARNDAREASSVTVMWVENERSKAMNDTAAAKMANVLVSRARPTDDLLMTYRLGEQPSHESNWT